MTANSAQSGAVAEASTDLELVHATKNSGRSGSNSNKPKPPASQQATVMVTGTSGSLTHCSAVTVTINQQDSPAKDALRCAFA